MPLLVINSIIVFVWINELGEFRKFTKRDFAMKKFGEINDMVRISDLVRFIERSYVADEILNILNQVNLFRMNCQKILHLLNDYILLKDNDFFGKTFLF